MPQRPAMAGPGAWAMQRSNTNPVSGPGHPGMGRSGPMGGPMINRSNSVPGATRSMLQQQLMDLGTGLLHELFQRRLTVNASFCGFKRI